MPKENLLSRPDQAYRANWPGWGAFLGSGRSNPKSPQEYVPIAEKLASDHGGVLPCSRWLMVNGFRAMEAVIRRNPEVFLHIKKDTKRKKIAEWVLVAESLATENGGILPGNGWLRKNGYTSLASAMWNHADSFAHIDQKIDGGKSPEEWVPPAEKLAHENGGVLPCCAWLVRNGYRGLHAALKRRPELFAHLSQDKKHKTPNEWVAIAERLASENGGVLQNANWLENNGYTGLAQCMRKFPELFNHIKQKRRNSKPADVRK